MRRAGFLATLAAGMGLLGASLHGLMSDVDTTLRVAAAPPPPATVVHERRVCDRERERPPSRQL